MMQFGVKPLSENVSVKFSDGNCYGLIGANGCGKSTFMKILGKDLEPTSGNISIDNHERVGKLRQDQFAFEEYVVLDAAEFESEFAELDSYSAEARAAELLLGVNIPSSQHHGFMSAIAPGFKKSVRILSGGEQGRTLFGKLILQKPNILFMDESGQESIESLNSALERYTSTLIFVSHDREFVSSLATRILEINSNSINDFKGNYEDYLRSQNVQ